MSRNAESTLGKMPMTRVRRRISRLMRSMGFVLDMRPPMLAWARHEGQRIAQAVFKDLHRFGAGLGVLRAQRFIGNQGSLGAGLTEDALHGVGEVLLVRFGCMRGQRCA